MVNENKNGYNLSVNGVIKKLFLGVLENCYYLGYFILFFWHDYLGYFILCAYPVCCIRYEKWEKNIESWSRQKRKKKEEEYRITMINLFRVWTVSIYIKEFELWDRIMMLFWFNLLCNKVFFLDGELGNKINRAEGDNRHK